MHEFHWWNWINVFFAFFNGFIAIGFFKDNNNFAGHLNMFAAVVNGLSVGLALS